ncbi:MAG: putative glycoside hydrolase [Patescibacteria group bacterium]
MYFSRKKNLYVVLFLTAVLVTGFSFISVPIESAEISLASVVIMQSSIIVPEPIPTIPTPIPPPEKLKNPSEIIKAVYVTGWSAGSKSYLNYLTDLFKTTEINAVVIDIKDYSGLISYKSGAIPDINALIRFFHDQNIYVIGRISVFEDPTFLKARPDLAIFDKTKTTDSAKILWYDNHRLSWLDPASTEVWDYNISIAKDVLARGFDEVNFDYIRFPSDGKTQNMGFPYWDEKIPMRVVLKNFYKYLRQELPDAKLSADLFGQTTVNSDDLGVGQIIEDALEYFDYVSPMVYPSHYATNFMGFLNPAEYPYEVVNYSMQTALAKKTALAELKTAENASVKLAELRPWLQDFNMGAFYTAEMVKSEIKASQDSLKDNFAGYLLWSPSNVYSKNAILK